MKNNMTQAQLIQEQLTRWFKDAHLAGRTSVNVRASELHDAAAHHWNYQSRMPNVCSVMRQNIQAKDLVLHAPPSGQGRTLLIRYTLPR